MSLLALLADTAPTAPNLRQWRNAVDLSRTGTSFGNLTSGSTTGTATMTLTSDAAQVTLTYMAATGSSNAQPTPNDVTYTATVNGQQVTWGGHSSGVCPAGGTITSDPLTIGGKTGDQLTIVTIATGNQVPRGHKGPIMPLKVNARTDHPAILVLGSSSGVPVEFTAGMTQAGLAVCNGSIDGMRAHTFTNDLLDMMGISGQHGFTHAFLQVGINSNAEGVTGMCQSAIDLAWRLRDRGIDHITQMVWKPSTNSTDGWATVEGQTPRAGGREQAVAWLRSGAPVTADGTTLDLNGTTPGGLSVGDLGHPFDAICDFSEPLQASGNPHVFRVDHGPLTTDGTHINATAYSLAQPAIYHWANSIAQ